MGRGWGLGAVQVGCSPGAGGVHPSSSGAYDGRERGGGGTLMWAKCWGGGTCFLAEFWFSGKGGEGPRSHVQTWREVPAETQNLAGDVISSGASGHGAAWPWWRVLSSLDLSVQRHGCLQGRSPDLGNLFEAGVLYPTRSLVNASCTNSSLEQSCWFSHPSPTCPLGATEQPRGGGLVTSPSCGMKCPQVLGWFLGLGGCTERHCLAHGDVFGCCLSDSNGGGGTSQLVQCSSGTAAEGVGLPGPKSSKNNGEKEK